MEFTTPQDTDWRAQEPEQRRHEQCPDLESHLNS